FARLWRATAFEDHASPLQANATAVMVEDEALRLEELTLDELLVRYAVQYAQNSRRPSTRLLSARSYERNPLVIAIARLRASHRCEVPQCAHPTFETIGGIPYTEVHHIIPLADGGEDTIGNAVCLCPAHHREAHLGTRAAELTALLT